jgi:imidazolonepropionase-like amidohydrolase
MNSWRTVGCVVRCLATLGAYCTSVAAHDIRIEHITVVSPERSSSLADATVLIRGDRIDSISNNAPSDVAGPSGTAVQVIDGRGLYLAPGLIDSHVHVADIPGMTPEHEQAHPAIARSVREQIPRSYLYFGFTTLVNLISTPAQIAQWNGYRVHPDIYFCGAAPVVDGYPMNWTPKPQRYDPFPYMLIQRGDEASAPAGIDAAAHTPEAVVSRMKADGMFCVKSFFERGFGAAQNLPVPRLDTMRSLVRAAHAAGMPMFLHANSSDAQAFAVEAGVDIIAHGMWHWNAQPKIVAQLTPDVQKILDGVIEAGLGWQPTIQVLYGERDLFDPAYLSDPMLPRVLPADVIDWYKTSEGQWFHNILAQGLLPKSIAESRDVAAQWNAIRAFYAGFITRNDNATRYMASRNARILFGTDTPSAPTYANPPGLNGWLEMRKLVAVGMTPHQVFVAATLANARALGLADEIGTVEPGKRANLILLRTDPTRTVQAYDDIVKVVIRGEVIERAELAAGFNVARGTPATGHE